MLCVKLEINHGYTTVHGQPIIKNNILVTTDLHTAYVHPTVTSVYTSLGRIGGADLNATYF